MSKAHRSLAEFQQPISFVSLVQTFLNIEPFECIQMAVIISAAGEYFTGDIEQAFATYDILNLDHVCQNAIDDRI